MLMRSIGKCFAGKDAFEGNHFEDFIEAVSAKEWHKAGEKLEGTLWCSENKERCGSDLAIIYEGCAKIDFPSITQVAAISH